MYCIGRLSEKDQETASSTSTPKRRRLERILRPKLKFETRKNEDFVLNYSPIDEETCGTESSSERCDSPHLPCNQVEYLYESNNSSISDIPCSPGVVECATMRDVGRWESLIASTNKLQKLCDQKSSTINIIEEMEEISAEMFTSKLEQSNCLNHVCNTSKIDKNFKENVEQSFDVINQSICQINNDKNCDKSSLFDTKDSFLLDIKESGMVCDIPTNKDDVLNKLEKEEGFYGLPEKVKDLFKTYRNIENFYDWQEECLNLDAIKKRKNLIYALPTSGGKTLVAEVLMLREVLVQKKNALFILPFVAIVQEKICALAPFAVQLDFLVEEYAGSKGIFPPKKRRKKNSIYIATIEKGLGLIRSLIELNRLDEIGLIVVDELHLIGEPSRGATLEILLTTVLFASQNIEIVGMSATIGNLPELAQFLRADVFTRHFRPVELTERVKVGDTLYRIRWGDAVEFQPEMQLINDYSESDKRLDPDGVAALVWNGRAPSSCLVFCPTKKNCENVAALLCKLQPSELAEHKQAERLELERTLRREGAAGELWRAARRGVAFHHAGLAPDERAAVEHAFRVGVLTVLCCTSTLAAGVNLPAARVLVRAPRVGREFITLAAYRQMAGRAGRAGVCDTGESIIMCEAREWALLKRVFARGVEPARSTLAAAGGVSALLLSGVALGLASTRAALLRLAACTLLAVPRPSSTPEVPLKKIFDGALRGLLASGAVEAAKDGTGAVCSDTELTVSKLAKAAIKGCMDLSTAQGLLQDLEVASRSLVLMGSLHLLYLVTPQDGMAMRLDYRHYYSLYCNLDDEGIQTAKILGITEMNAIRMMTGKPITNVSENVLRRFYIALILRDLWNQVPLPVVADKYLVARGTAQSMMTSAAATAGAAHRLCQELPARWACAALLAELAPRLRHCAAPHLHALLELPGVKKARALQLVRAGYRRVEDVARAASSELARAVTHLSRSAAEHLVSAARMMLIEKVENLRAEAEEVMEDLNI